MRDSRRRAPGRPRTLSGSEPSSGVKATVSVPLPVEAEVGGAVLVAEGVAADDDRLVPAGHEARDVRDDDRLAEDHAAEDVADGAVRARHIFFRPNSSTRASSGVMVAHLTPTPCFWMAWAAVDRDLVVGRVAVLDAEVVVLEVDVEVRVDQGVLDLLPDDACHLVAVELDDGAFDLDLGPLLFSSR